MQILVMLEDFHDPCPEGAELEAFLAHPKHHLARLIRDLFADEAAATTMEVPRILFPSISCCISLSGKLYLRCDMSSGDTVYCRHFRIDSWAKLQMTVGGCCVRSQRESANKGRLAVQNPIQAIVQHSEHNVLYAQDPLMQGFHSRHISHMLDIVCENQGQTGFTVAEVGAGTGGFTRQVIPLADLPFPLWLHGESPVQALSCTLAQSCGEACQNRVAV